MLTGSEESAYGTSFKRAVEGSAFDKVFHNNMDKNSFNNDIDAQIKLMVLNSKTAYFTAQSTKIIII